jgi:acetyltransferase-like isoleucine patch superfamily enzyme
VRVAVHRLRLIALRLRARGRLRTGRGVRLGRGARVAVAGAGSVVLGDGVVLGERARFDVDGGTVAIGAGTRIGAGFVVVCHERVTLGARVRAGDDVVLQDVARVFADPERPIREQGLVTAPVAVGDDAVLGARSVVERGVRVGDRAVVDAGARVTADVAAGATARGVSARVSPR